MQAEYLNSINNLVDVLEHIADHRQDMHNKCIDVHNLRGSVNAWNHFFLVLDAKKKVEEMMPFVLMEFCACLRGEEVPLLSLQGLTTFWEETTTARDPFIMLTLRGRFKGEGELRWHCIPIPCNTRTGLPVLKWIRRMLRRLVVDEQRTTGWVFADANVNAGSWATTMLCLLIC